MKLRELLAEAPVQSSWITDMHYGRKQRLIHITLSSGRVYTIVGASEDLYRNWMNSESKGKFFHQYLRGKFKVWRIK